MSLQSQIYFFIYFRFFISTSYFFRSICYTLIEGLEVGDDELSIDDLDITLRVDTSTDMVDIGIIECSYYLEDSIDRAYM